MDIRFRHLVSLNTARIKLRKQHPRIAEDLRELFEMLKDELHQDEKPKYQQDGYLDIEE